MTLKIVSLILVVSVLAHLHWLRGKLLELSQKLWPYFIKETFLGYFCLSSVPGVSNEERKTNNGRVFCEYG